MNTNEWRRMCHDTEMSSIQAKLLPMFPWVADLLDHMVARFCALPAPRNSDEMQQRKCQEKGLDAIRTKLLLTNDMTRMALTVEVAIAEECRRMCERTLPTNAQEHSELQHELIAIDGRLNDLYQRSPVTWG